MNRHQPRGRVVPAGDFGDPKHAGSELRSVLSRKWPHTSTSNTRAGRSIVRRRLPEPGAASTCFATTFDGDDAYLYFLIEHQSSPDDLDGLPDAALPVRIWERHLKTEPTTSGQDRPTNDRAGSAHQGHRRWTAPTDIADIIKVSDHAATAFADLLPHVRYILDDLTVVDEAARRARLLRPRRQESPRSCWDRHPKTPTSRRRWCASLDDWQTVADTEPALPVVFFTYLQ